MGGCGRDGDPQWSPESNEQGKVFCYPAPPAAVRTQSSVRGGEGGGRAPPPRPLSGPLARVGDTGLAWAQLWHFLRASQTVSRGRPGAEAAFPARSRSRRAGKGTVLSDRRNLRARKASVPAEMWPRAWRRPQHFLEAKINTDIAACVKVTGVHSVSVKSYAPKPS